MVDNTEARARLIALLEEQHTFPSCYTHKVIGKNTEQFRSALQRLVIEFKEIKIVDEKTTASGLHVSVTFELNASGPHAIADLVEMSGQLPDVIYVL